MKPLNGIHLPHHKQTESMQITSIPLPKTVRIPMLMHMGKACTPAVGVGDHVTVGQLIGAADGDFSVPVHSSVSGSVTALTDYETISGEVVPCIEIASDGRQIISPECIPPELNNKEDLIRAARESGCVGLGGSGRPTYLKLAAKQKIDMLIINGAESEPYLTSDCRQMIEAPDDIIGGIALIMKLMKIKEARIAIEANKPAAIKLMTEAAEKQKGITVVPLPAVYPQGAEKVVIFHTCGRVVPEYKTSADIGVLVLNVSTCAFLYQYSQTGIPLVERVVTVAGDAVTKPANLRVPVGTPVKELLEYTSCEYDKVRRLLCGGPMMGSPLPSFDDPVIIRQQNGLLAMRAQKKRTESACMRCGRCMRACPMGLMPMELDRAYEKRDVNLLEKLHIMLCMNCGCCTYVCPAHRPLAENIQLAKATLSDQGKGGQQ